MLTIGVVIGSRLGSDGAPTTPVETTSAPETTRPNPTPPSASIGSATFPRTRDGAVDAATAAMLAFDTTVVLDDARLRETVNAVAARAFREPLLQSYRQGAALLRDRLAIDSVPRPVYFVRTAPVGYRIERYSADAATVAIWNVGVIGSGASVQPQQAWSTQHVTLRWENGAWKVTGFRSEPGPTPPLGSAEAAAGAGELFETVPTFSGFSRAAR